MSIAIAGKQVVKGSKLYHITLQMWGYVVDVDTDTSTAVIEFKTVNGLQVHRFTVTQGGLINGRRALYWHEPIYLDLPTENVETIQKVVDVLAEDSVK